MSDRCDQGTPEFCRTVSVGGKTRRYAVVRAEAPTRDTVIIDFGGPGTAVLASSGLASYHQALPPSLRVLNIVAVEEPWVTAPVPDSCRDALRRHHESQRAGADTGAAVTTSCDLGPGEWGWSPAAYRDTVAAVSAKEDLRTVGFIGASFGATRSTYLSQRGWVILVSPSPPTATGRDLLDDRARSTRDRLAELCNCAPGDVDRRLGDAAQRFSSPVASDQRSVPVTSGDVGAAAVGLARPFPQATSLAPGLLGPTPDSVVVGRLSDSVWERYGERDIAPSYLGYLDELCATYRDWGAPEQARPVETFLSHYHDPCRTTPIGEPTPGPTLAPGGTCIIATLGDPVTPPRYAQRWHDAIPGSRLFDATLATHGRADLTPCVPDEVTPPG